MNRTQRTLLVAAAITGLLSGVVVKAQDTSTNTPGTNAPSSDNGKHDCKGQNSCKGKGGCQAGDNGCKGKNTCKGKGGCKTMLL